MLKTLWKHGRLIGHNAQWRRITLVLILLASLGAVLWIIVRDWYNLVTYDWRFEWGYLALSGVAYIGALALAIAAWIVIMTGLRARLSWKEHGRYFIYSWMARRLPTPAPFVASRVLLYEQAGVPRRLSLAGMLWEQLLLFASGGWLVVLLFPFTPTLSERLPLAPAILLALICVALVLQPQVLTARRHRLLRHWKREPLTSVLTVPGALAALILHTLLWLSGGVIFFLMVRSIYLVNWEMLPVFVQIWVASGLIGYISFFVPIVPGVRDMGMIALLTIVVPLSVALIIALLVRLWITLNELFWALVFSRL
ncbi:MAG: hypothetical protein SNJ69_13955 [Chloroflexaceae bacterium]